MFHNAFSTPCGNISLLLLNSTSFVNDTPTPRLGIYIKRHSFSVVFRRHGALKKGILIETTKQNGGGYRPRPYYHTDRLGTKPLQKQPRNEIQGWTRCYLFREKKKIMSIYQQGFHSRMGNVNWHLYYKLIDKLHYIPGEHPLLTVDSHRFRATKRLQSYKNKPVNL